MNIKRCYCDQCNNYRDFIRIGRKSMGENYSGIGRVMIGLMSLGFSEASTDCVYYKCTKCGKIIKRNS